LCVQRGSVAFILYREERSRDALDKGRDTDGGGEGEENDKLFRVSLGGKGEGGGEKAGKNHERRASGKGGKEKRIIVLCLSERKKRERFIIHYRTGGEFGASAELEKGGGEVERSHLRMPSKKRRNAACLSTPRQMQNYKKGGEKRGEAPDPTLIGRKKKKGGSLFRSLDWERAIP